MIGTTTAAAAGGGVLVGAVVATVVCRRYSSETEYVDGTIDVEDLPTNPADEHFQHYVELPEPKIKTSSSIPGASLYAAWKHHIKKRKLAAKGYVRWIRVENGVWSEPKYVKPQRTDSNKYPIVREDGSKYLFPAEAAAVDERSGMRTWIHRDGEAEPINIHESEGEVLSAEDVLRLEQTEVSTSPPSLWDRMDLDLDPQTILVIGIAATLVLSVVGGWF